MFLFFSHNHRKVFRQIMACSEEFALPLSNVLVPLFSFMRRGFSYSISHCPTSSTALSLPSVSSSSPEGYKGRDRQ